MSDPVLEPLNPEQRAAVTHGDGPLLILAGAGSGKTRVLTHRIAHLIRDREVAPRAILAVTFTNKAAREMRDRLQRLVGEATLDELSVGTFHAFCARLLRREARTVGLEPGFAIYDEADQLSVLRRAMDEAGVPDRLVAPAAIASVISSAKNELKGPADLASADTRRSSGDGAPVGRRQLERLVALVWPRYDGLLRASDAVDFDDLLLLACRALEVSDEALTH